MGSVAWEMDRHNVLEWTRSIQPLVAFIEENTISLVADLGELCYGARRVGDEFEVLARCDRGHCDPCRVLHVVAPIGLGHVTGLHTARDATPFNVSGKDRRRYRLPKYSAAGEAVGNGEGVQEREVAQVQGGRPFAEMDVYAVFRDGDSPEESARSDAGVIGMRAKLAREAIESNKGEGASVGLAVQANVGTLHESPVGVEGIRRGLARPGVYSCPAHFKFGDAKKAVEIGDGRRLVARIRRTGEVEVKVERSDGIGDWPRRGAAIVIGSGRYGKAGAKRQTGRCSRSLQHLPTGENRLDEASHLAYWTGNSLPLDGLFVPLLNSSVDRMNPLGIHGVLSFLKQVPC